MKLKLKHFIKLLFDIFKKPEMAILPGQLAFFFIMSIVPIFSLVGIFYGFFESSINNLTDFIKDAFPADISNIVINIISGKSWDVGLIFFLITSFFIASNGAHSIIISSNHFYKLNKSNFLQKRIKAIFLTLIIVLLFMFIIIVPIFGNNIIDIMKKTDVLSGATDSVVMMFRIVKWPLTILFVFFNMKLIYSIAPDKTVKTKETTVGAIFTTTLWIISTNIFTYYVKHFASYDLFYGGISNIIILMLWLYILAYIFVVGIAINVSRENLAKEEQKV